MVWRRVAQDFFGRPAPPRQADAALAASLRTRLAGAEQKLGRSLAIRHVATGTCNGCELELRATQNLVHDLTQYGLSFTPSPRHADILLVTGVACRNMSAALREARAAMPEPVIVIAVGDCAVDGGVFKGSPAITGGTESLLPVDLIIAGCPPAPEQIIDGLLAVLEAQARLGKKCNR